VDGPKSSSTIPLANIGGVDYRPSSNGYTDYSIVSNSSPVGPLATWIYTGANPDEYSPAIAGAAGDALATLQRFDDNNVTLEYVVPHNGVVPSAGVKDGASVTFTIQYS